MTVPYIHLRRGQSGGQRWEGERGGEGRGFTWGKIREVANYPTYS